VKLLLILSFVAATVVAAHPTAAMAGTAEIIGDDLGVGVSLAAKLNSLARTAAAVHGGEILEQIRQLPRDTTAFMSLGMNDAVDGSVDVKKPVQDILAAIKAQDVKLVWLGPPCVFEPWDASAIKLDANLRRELEGTGVTCVSMRGADICARSMRGADGVHFNIAGYTLMWQKAAAAAGFPVVVVPANQSPGDIATPISGSSAALLIGVASDPQKPLVNLGKGRKVARFHINVLRSGPKTVGMVIAT
jgi:hypothetical protein